MKKTLPIVAALAASFALSFAAVSAFAAGKAKSYQVTGPVVELTDTKVVVEKDGEKWEIARTKDLKAEGGELKVGARVTIEYAMTATSIEVKGDKAKAEKGEKAEKAAKPSGLKK